MSMCLFCLVDLEMVDLQKKYTVFEFVKYAGSL